MAAERIVHLRRNLAWTACGIYAVKSPLRWSKSLHAVTCKRCLRTKVAA